MMKKLNGKKLAMAVMMSMAVSVTCAANEPEAAVVADPATAVVAAEVTAEVAPAPEVVEEVVAPVVEKSVSVETKEVAAPAAAATTVAVQVEVKQPVAKEQKNVARSKGVFNWEKGADADIVAVGVGYPGPTGHMGNARTAAKVDAQRNLLETIKGTEIDANTLVESLMVKSDVVKTAVGGLLVGARIIEEGQNSDGSYYVKMSVPMFGAQKSLAATIIPQMDSNVTPEPLPEVTETQLPEAEVQEIKSVTYTGVVVDADGLGLEPTFAPVIYDTNGRIVYGLANLDKNLAISKGMVDYANVVQEATSGSRAGANPLVVKALSVRGGANSVNPVNVVVSVDDADKILLANENSGMLQNTAVVFVK